MERARKRGRGRWEEIGGQEASWCNFELFMLRVGYWLPLLYFSPEAARASSGQRERGETESVGIYRKTTKKAWYVMLV